MFQFSSIIFALFLSAVVAGASATIAWRDREVIGATSFVVLMSLVSVWSASYGIQLLFTNAGWQLFWDRVQYVSGFCSPVAFFVFVLYYTGHESVLSRRRLVAIAAPSLVVGTMIWIPGAQSFVRTDAYLVADHAIVLLNVEYGPLFYLTLVYSYVLVAVALGLLLVTAVRTPRYYRQQVGLVTAGAVVPITGSGVTYLFDVTTVDLTPVALSVFGLTVAVALTRYRLLSVLPVARDRVIKQIDDGIVVTDTNERIIDINPAASEILDIDDVIGRPLSALESERAAVLTETTEQSTRELVTENGHRRYYEVRKAPFLDARSTGQAHLYILHDVTARQTREQWFASLTEHSTDIVCVLDATLVVTYVSPSLESILGYETATFEDSSILEFVHPEDTDDVRRTLLSEAGESGRVTYRARRVDGSWRTLESRSKNRLSDPVIEGIVVTTRDVTESQTQKRKLERQNERLDAFASVVSHDLRNPLSVAKGFAEVAEEDPKGEHFERIHRAHDRMEEIIEDVLMVAQSGHAVDEWETVAVERVATDAWTQVVTDEATLTVDETMTVACDPPRLQQAFENLFRNAVEHGGSDVHVEVGRLPDGFYVEDDGVGIPPEERERVFDSGYSTASDGFGVGLAVVKAVVEGHDWTVSVTAGERGGTRFEIRTAGARR